MIHMSVLSGLTSKQKQKKSPRYCSDSGQIQQLKIYEKAFDVQKNTNLNTTESHWRRSIKPRGMAQDFLEVDFYTQV